MFYQLNAWYVAARALGLSFQQIIIASTRNSGTQVLY